MEERAKIPSRARGLQACTYCLLVQAKKEWSKGCVNCGRPTPVTSVFAGLVAMMQPRRSWVAKYQKIVELVPGMYAIKVIETEQRQVLDDDGDLDLDLDMGYDENDE